MGNKFFLFERFADMKKKSKPEWERFKVWELSVRRNWVDPGCQSFSEVSHVSHIKNALNIVSEGKLKSGLIFDECKLNEERILVNWVSPNDWDGAGGFRYGHIRYTFNWQKLIDGMNYFWVESIAYGIPACRILVTEKDYSDTLSIYDPTLRDGPWWYDKSNDKHYRNGHYCLEIMVERDLYFSEVIEVDFVQHHPRFCCLPYRCDEQKLRTDKAGSIFIAGIVGQNIDCDWPKFYKKKEDRLRLEWSFEESVEFIWRYIENLEDFSGKLKSTDDAALPLARAILSAYANSNHDEIEKLVPLFKSQKSLKYSCAKLLAETFGIPEWKFLLT